MAERPCYESPSLYIIFATLENFAESFGTAIKKCRYAITRFRVVRDKILGGCRLPRRREDRGAKGAAAPASKLQMPYRPYTGEQKFSEKKKIYFMNTQ